MAPSAPTPALRVQGLTKRFGARTALASVDLEVPAGAAFGLVGANGAGKTTLLKCALDHCAPDAGRVELFGVGAAEPRARARLAYLPERFSPPYYMLGREFLALACALAGGRFERAAAERLLAELELEADVLDRPARQLSKGMSQKLGLAGCLLPDRDLHLLDEPMSGLDPAARVAAKQALARRQRAGRTLFLTSHVLADVEEICSRIAVLDRGRVRFAGPPRDLCARTGVASLERAFLACIRDVEAARP